MEETQTEQRESRLVWEAKEQGKLIYALVRLEPDEEERHGRIGRLRQGSGMYVRQFYKVSSDSQDELCYHK